MEIVRRISGMLGKYKRLIALALVMQTLVILSRLVTPLITKTVVNDVITGGNTALLYPLCAGLIALALLRAACNYVRGLCFEQSSQNVAYDLRVNLYKHLQEMPNEFYDKHRIGEIMSRMTGDIEGVRNMLAGGIFQIYDNVLCFIGSLIFLAFLSWQLTLLMLIFAPLIGVCAYYLGKKIRPAFAAIREQNAVLNTRVQENLAGIRVVKAFAREDYESQRFANENQKAMELNIKATLIWANYGPLMDMISGMCSPILLFGGGVMMFTGRMDLGTMVGVIGYVWMVTNPMRMVSNLINMTAQALSSAEKLLYYIDLGSTLKEPPNALTPPHFKGHVSFDHVTFAYSGGVPVLTDITFEAQPGETVAVMGATGAGKSTLVGLLGRYYDVKSGSVKIDGIDVRAQQLAPLRREIGYVMQETFLFSDSLEDNIRFGRPNADHNKVLSAAQVAQAQEFIDAMPRGYDTVVGERGLGLSGGQKQRTAIARAVLTDPAILVLDDSTSAVDMETEYEIQQQLKSVLKNRTTFIIAHRISSVKNADQILVLDNSTIAERGNHISLMAHGGIYYRMVRDQYQDMAAGGDA